MKGDAFMCTPNTLFYSDKALFDETMFPRCSDGHPHGKTHGTTQLNKPPSDQPPAHDDDIIPDDFDDLPPPEPPKGDGAPKSNVDPPQSKGKGKQPALPDPTPDMDSDSNFGPMPGPSQPRAPVTPPR